MDQAGIDALLDAFAAEVLTYGPATKCDLLELDWENDIVPLVPQPYDAQKLAFIKAKFGGEKKKQGKNNEDYPKVFLTLLQHCNRPSLDAPLSPLPAAVQLIWVFFRFFFRHTQSLTFSPFAFSFLFRHTPVEIQTLGALFRVSFFPLCCCLPFRYRPTFRVFVSIFHFFSLAPAAFTKSLFHLF